MDDGLDYDVHTKVTFLLDFDGTGELNLLALPDVRRAFSGHVRDVFQRDRTLGSYVCGDLTFQFHGRYAELEYTFGCHDENEAEAESFSDFCVQAVKRDLEAFGCKLKQIRCTAEESDMTWLDQLEDKIFAQGMEM